jgi:hypothetical protein
MVVFFYILILLSEQIRTYVITYFNFEKESVRIASPVNSSLLFICIAEAVLATAVIIDPEKELFLAKTSVPEYKTVKHKNSNTGKCFSIGLFHFLIKKNEHT